jgi:hypothetical protein
LFLPKESLPKESLPKDRIADENRAVERTSLIWSWRRSQIGIRTAAHRAMITT